MDLSPSAPAAALPLRILYAEDTAELRLVLTEVFRCEGHHVTAVANGVEALRVFAENDAGFDLLITDHRMPVLSGLELLSRLRSADYRGRAVLHSSLEDLSVLDAYAALQLDAFLPKPSSLAQLRGLLQRFSPSETMTPAGKRSAAHLTAAGGH